MIVICSAALFRAVKTETAISESLPLSTKVQDSSYFKLASADYRERYNSLRNIFIHSFLFCDEVNWRDTCQIPCSFLAISSSEVSLTFNSNFRSKSAKSNSAMTSPSETSCKRSSLHRKWSKLKLWQWYSYFAYYLYRDRRFTFKRNCVLHRCEAKH